MAPPSCNNDNNTNGQDDDDFAEVHQLLSLRKSPSIPVGVNANTCNDLLALTKLDLPDCQLSTLPSSLPDALPNLSILFLSGNKFTEVPPVIGACKNLQMVAFKANDLTSIHPDALQSQLRWLILTDNKLTEIPDTIGRCTILQKLMLSGNLLTELPDSISNCQNLELVRLSSNQLEKPPMKLLELPNLCWVALSGNPFIRTTQLATEGMKLQLPVLEDIPEGVGDVLGEGAGGITRKVTWRHKLVAVKTFCGAMTSDGSPEDERMMSLTVSSKIRSHHLISLLGETCGGSLVMEYLDNYKALAGPPSLETCSRDVYDHSSCDGGGNNYMTEDQAVSMVSGLLDVLTNLHAHGIIHGDFYAHNILVSDDDRYKVKLSDFGAAFFYDTRADYGPKLCRTELRALGHLVDEVQELFVRDTQKKSMLRNLAQSCRDETATFTTVNNLWKEACDY